MKERLVPLKATPHLVLWSIICATLAITFFAAGGRVEMLCRPGFGLSLVSVLGGAFALSLLMHNRRDVTLTPDSILIRSTFYTANLPRQQIREARVLGADHDPRLLWRRNGVGLPGLTSGWLTGQDGEYFVDFTTKPNLQISTTAGYDILLQVKDPAAFIAQLPAAA
ncbi:MAG: hypothetical protein Q4D19_04690 [Lautropia sp.]|nr:hypothetical protein [Lautropia sp.]